MSLYVAPSTRPALLDIPHTPHLAGAAVPLCSAPQLPQSSPEGLPPPSPRFPAALPVCFWPQQPGTSFFCKTGAQPNCFQRDDLKQRKAAERPWAGTQGHDLGTDTKEQGALRADAALILVWPFMTSVELWATHRASRSLSFHRGKWGS